MDDEPQPPLASNNAAGEKKDEKKEGTGLAAPERRPRGVL